VSNRAHTVSGVTGRTVVAASPLDRLRTARSRQGNEEFQEIAHG